MLAKHLSHSDRSYFRSYHQDTGMRQKAINLDKRRMRSLFPSLADAENTASYSAKVDWFFGDGPNVEVVQNITLSRKNWRLNSMPWVDADVGSGGAIIVCQILGDEGPPQTRSPTGVALALLREGDQGYAWLDARLPPGGFANIDDGELLAAESWEPTSAIWQLIDFLTQGLGEMVRDVIADPSSTSVSRLGLQSIDRNGSTREAIERLSQLRSAIGLGGETLVDAVLERQLDAHVVHSYEWCSISNATAPMDFLVNDGGCDRAIEVKTTKGHHDRSFPISVPELRVARVQPYEIWRVSEFESDTNELRGDIRRTDPTLLVKEALDWLDTSRPPGVSVSTVEFDPNYLTWSEMEPAACPVTRVPSATWQDDMSLAV